VCACACTCTREEVGENKSALSIKHYALQLFGCVSHGNSLFGNWTSYIRQEMMKCCSCYSEVQT